MTIQSTSPTAWNPPGPGAWERDAAHQERPFSKLWLETALPSFGAGFADAFARFGIPFAGFKTADVEGWFFGTLVPVDDDEFPARVEAAERALLERPWRVIADEWHETVRDRFARRNRELQAVNPAGIDDHALADHIGAALALFSESSERHFLHAVAHWVGVGLLLNAAAEHADWTTERAVQALAGASPASTSSVAALHRIASVIASEPIAAAALKRRGSPDEVLAALRASSPWVSAALDAYLDTHGWQVFTGFDFTHQAVAELPHLFLQTIREVSPPVPATTDLLESLRAIALRIPGMDAVIDDAVITYGLRDDDSGITIQHPVGLVRRALLEAGRRLHARGVIRDPDDLFDATTDELSALLSGIGAVPDANDLAIRASRRREYAEVPPRRLGNEAPPDETALPPGMGAILNALFAAMSLEDTPDIDSALQLELRGAGASAGVYEGRARLIRGEGDFERLERGDILVAQMTTPAYNVVLPLLGAVVTDRGGILSHPAIVAREYRIPAVVGTGNATALIRDGVHLRVDGTAGTVTILG